MKDNRKNLLRFKTAIILILTVFLVTVLPGSGQEQETDPPFGIVIHGGAGAITKKTITKKREKQYREKLQEALAAGYRVLEKGGSSLDAVEAAVKIMEDSPLFNAGKGAVFTGAGANELDAAIMDGKTLNAGAIAGVKRIKNPISLARLVMKHSPHVMLVREGAEAFAGERGIELVSPDYFFTERRWQSLQKIKAREKKEKKKKSQGGRRPKPIGHAKSVSWIKKLRKKTRFSHIVIKGKSARGRGQTPTIVEQYGTVGAAALDKAGNLAAGTSTGGMTNKKFGRVGDSPVIGAGTYANNRTCAVSATGHGEYFIRSVAAYDISALMEYKGLALQEAAEQVVHKIKELGGTGGFIAIDSKGNIAMPFSAVGMFRGYAVKGGKIIIQMYKE